MNFSQLDYMNSTGIDVIVSLLAAARRSQNLLAHCLSDHYRGIFELTQLNEAISIYGDEATARATY